MTRLRITPLSLGMLALLWSELRSSVQDVVSIKIINVEHKNPLDNTGMPVLEAVVGGDGL